MLLVAVAVLILVLVPLTGGRLGALADLEFRAVAVLAGGLAIQIVTVSVIPDGPPGLYRALHLVSYASAAWFVVANRRVPWLWLSAVGATTNAFVIALNGGVMPASASAMRTAGRVADSGFANSSVVRDPVLPFLGDVFPVPAGVPLANVFSIGDVLIAAGAFLLVFSVCRSRQPLALQAPAPSPST